MRELGCGGPCALRCHTNASSETLALARQAMRYVSVAYEFSSDGHADRLAWVKRKTVPHLPLERA
jgi:hypothetical protein